MERDELDVLVKSGLVGFLIADALGYPFQEGIREANASSIDTVDDDESMPPGTYTSKSASMLCVMATLAEFERFDPEDFAVKLYNHYIAGYMSCNEECDDIGVTTIQAVKNHSNGMPYDKCGELNIVGNDGEAIGRGLPIGIFYCNNAVDELITAAHQASLVTHAHPLSQVATALYALLCRNLFSGRKEKATELLLDYYDVKSMEGHRSNLEHLLQWKESGKLRGTQQIEDVFWSAWHCYSTRSSDYETAVRSAIAYGHATNLVGALTGGLSGLSNGLGSIPGRWLQVLRITDEMTAAVNVFVDALERKL